MYKDFKMLVFQKALVKLGLIVTRMAKGSHNTDFVINKSM